MLGISVNSLSQQLLSTGSEQPPLLQTIFRAKVEGEIGSMLESKVNLFAIRLAYALVNEYQVAKYQFLPLEVRVAKKHSPLEREYVSNLFFPTDSLSTIV